MIVGGRLERAASGVPRSPRRGIAARVPQLVPCACGAVPEANPRAAANRERDRMKKTGLLCALAAAVVALPAGAGSARAAEDNVITIGMTTSQTGALNVDSTAQ